MSDALATKVIWAILPDMLPRLADVLSGSEAASRVALFEQAGSPRDALNVSGGIATINVLGVLTKSPGLAQFLGGTSYGQIQAQLAEAQERADVRAVLLNIDSPGGEVDGAQETAEAVKDLAGSKPVVVHGGGLLASAAYWIASAANRVVISPTALAGSIGVALMHIDRSKENQGRGIKVTHIASGELKRITNPDEPLSDEGRAYLQRVVDAYAEVFLTDVASNRNLSDVQKGEVAKAGVFVGKQALGVGLVDEVSNFAGARKRLASMVPDTPTAGAAAVETENESSGGLAARGAAGELSSLPPSLGETPSEPEAENDASGAFFRQVIAAIAGPAQAATDGESSGGLAASGGAGGQAFPPSASETGGEIPRTAEYFIKQILAGGTRMSQDQLEKALDEALAAAVAEHNARIDRQNGQESQRTAGDAEALDDEDDEAVWDRALEKAVADFNRNVAS